MPRGPELPAGGSPVSSKVLGILRGLQLAVMMLPAELRLQLAGALRGWLDEFEQSARQDFERVNPPRNDYAGHTYTTTGQSR